MTELSGCLLHELMYGVAVRNVERLRVDINFVPGAKLFSRLRDALLITREDGQRGALLGKRGSGCSSDAVARAGDDSNTAFESRFHRDAIVNALHRSAIKERNEVSEKRVIVAARCLSRPVHPLPEW